MSVFDSFESPFEDHSHEVTLEKRQRQPHERCAGQEENRRGTSSRAGVAFEPGQARCQKGEVCVLTALRLLLWSVIFWSH